MKLLVAAATAIALLAFFVARWSLDAPVATTLVPLEAATSTKLAAAPTGGTVAFPPASAASAVPAGRVDFPLKGRRISLIVPFAAGGSHDTQARMVAALMSKSLGTPVEVNSRPGSGSRIGLQELAKALPDGYTIGLTSNPTTIGVYLQTAPQPTLGRKSFDPVAMFGYDAEVIAVKNSSPYKTVQGYLDASRASPETITASCNGFMSVDHLAVLQLARLSGASFSIVNFDGAGESMAALLGGRIDSMFASLGSTIPQVESGEVRILAVMDRQRSKFLPEVPTLESLGYKVYSGSDYSLSAPAATSGEIVGLLSASVSKATRDPNLIRRLEAGLTEARYLDPLQLGSYWDEAEAQIRPVVGTALRQSLKK